ncbi:MAG: trypsin-like peptidase domain-containing protein [Patescibacteria group bacterium]
MFVFLKEAILFGVSLLGGILVFFGLIPSHAVAPDVKVPTPVTAVPHTTPLTSELEEQTSERDVSTPSPSQESEKSQTVIENYEASLEQALLELARIQREQQTPTEAPLGLNEKVRSALVNILCTTASAGTLSPISASGVIIDPRGVVLTNAHVAQYYLLKDYPSPGFVDCVLRTGSPATATYKAELLFLPPSWIAKNAHKIDDETPTGNGEHDYALLRITGAVGSHSVPAALPYLPLVLDAPLIGTPVLLAGYPAGFLGGITITKELYAASANASVGQVYTFDTNTVDLFSIGGSIVAQQGSSGGAAAQANSTSPNGAALLGLITTSSDAPDTGSRDLRALSTEYIIRDFEAERGLPLASYLGMSLKEEQERFALSTAPTLSSALITVLEQ